MKQLLHALCLVVALISEANLTSDVYADVKIKTKIDSGSESTTYIKGKRQRMELGGGETAIITQCDMKRTVGLNQPTKTYTVSLFNQKTDVATTETAANDDRTKPTPNKRGGVITSTITTKDTGERQQMFGFTARRIKTSMVSESSPDACSKDKSRIDSDGWYIDLGLDFNCDNERASAAIAGVKNGGGCRDEYRTKQIGTAKLGFPVKVTTTLYDENNKATNSFTQEVIELSKATLEPALFDVPADYREVKNAQEIYAAMSAASASNDDARTTNNVNATNGGMGANARNLAEAKPTQGTIPAKKEGVIRIGVAMTKTTSVGEGLNAATLSEAVRNTMVNYLTGPAIEVIALDARLPVQIDAEAKQKECDYVLYTTVAHKKGKSGGFGGFLKAAAPIADVVPLAGASSAAGAVATSVATTAIYTAANVAGSVKAKDELTLEYKLNNASGSPVVANTLKAKAKSDGDDLISQLVEQAASAVLTQATKK